MSKKTSSVTKTLTSLLLIFLLAACAPKNSDYESEIRQVEQAFNDLAASKGIKEAFLTFADDSAVIVRNNQIYKGKSAIGSYFDQSTLQNITLTWEPEFIEVSEDGTLGYTYGPYHFQAEDSTGQQIKSEGLFHTVWKKKSDGSWKYVYD